MLLLLLCQFIVGITEDLLCNDRTFNLLLNWNLPVIRSAQTSPTSPRGIIVPDFYHWFILIEIIPSVSVKKFCYAVNCHTAV